MEKLRKVAKTYERILRTPSFPCPKCGLYALEYNGGRGKKKTYRCLQCGCICSFDSKITLIRNC